MDQIMHQELQTVSELFSKSQFLKKVLQFILSVSIFSYSSWLLVFLHLFNLYFSTSPFHFFNYTIDKKYMFLLCNGILVFLSRNSSLISSSPLGTDLHEEFSKNNGDGLESDQHEFSDMKYYVVEKEVVVESVGFLKNAVVEEDGAVGNEFLITEGEEEEEEEEENGFLIMVDEEEEEEEEEEGNGLLSTEELNKKFDDFIKRTKEGIRIEAQEQLVMV